MKKSDIKKLVKESVKEIKEQADGNTTLTSQGQSIHNAPGVWETDPLGKPESGGMSAGLEAREIADSFEFEEIEKLYEEGIITDDLYNGAKWILEGWIDMHPTYLPQRDLTTPKRLKIRNRYGIDEDSIRINSMGEQDQQAQPGGEEGGEQPEVEEAEPAHSPKDIGECKAKCLDMDLENLIVQKENIEAKLQDIQRKGVDLKPSALKQQRAAKRELLSSLKANKKQRKEIKKQQEQLLNPGEKQTNESINKKNMRANVKKLWDHYANDRLSKKKSLKEHMTNHKKLAKRKVLQESVMNTFFEYFDQGLTNEEIVQLYAEKGVSVPEPFAAKARKQHTDYSKMKFELEMSEKAFKNEASQIVNNPGSMGETMVTDEDKQLASGLFNEQDEVPAAPGEKELSDVSVVLKNIERINTSDELQQVLDKVMKHIADGNVTNGMMAMKKSLGTTAASNIAKQFGIK